MSFLDKLKTSVSEAGVKAKNLVEINKLKLINVSKNAEIDKLYKEIGEKVTNYAASNMDISAVLFQNQLEQIAILKHEIEQNNYQISHLSEEKLCPKCGRANTVNARYCIHCQASFTIIESAKPSKMITLQYEESKEKE